MVDLTQEGFEHIDEIINIIFQVGIQRLIAIQRRRAKIHFPFFFFQTRKHFIVHQYVANGWTEKMDLRRVFEFE